MSSHGVSLGADLFGYTIEVDGGPTLHVTYEGRNASDQSPGLGWTAIAAATGDGGGYDLYWKHASGPFGVWHLLETGALAEPRLLTGAEAFTAESLFGADWNGDGAVGLAPTFIALKTVEGVTLGTDALGYSLKKDDGTILQVTYGGANAGPNQPGQGWSAVAATVAEEGGFDLYWRHVSGTLGTWHLSDTGALAGSGLLGAHQLAYAESVSGADLDGNGVTVADGAGLISVFTTSSPDTDIAVGIALGLTEFGYAFQTEGGPVVQITSGGLDVSPDSPGLGWHAIGVGLGQQGSAYELYWKNADGRFQAWYLDAQGAEQAAFVLDAPRVLALENRLGVDLDGDGNVGLDGTFRPEVTWDSIDFGHNALGYAFSVNGATPLQILYEGVPASDDLPGQGWQAIGVTPSAAGYTLYWKHASGERGAWNLDAAGHFAEGTLLDVAQLKAAEARHGVDLDGDGQVVATSGIVDMPTRPIGDQLPALGVGSRAAGIQVSQDFTVLGSDGVGHVPLVLASEPVAPVTVRVVGRGDNFMVNGAMPDLVQSLVFTPDNWDTPQVVELVAFSTAPGSAPEQDSLRISAVSDDPAYAALAVQAVQFTSALDGIPSDGSFSSRLTDSLDAVAGRLVGGLSLVDLPLLGELGGRALAFLETIEAAIAGAIAGTNADSTFAYDQQNGSFAIGVSGLITLVHASVAGDLGLPALGFSTTGSVDVTLGYDLHAEGVASLDGFWLTPAATWAKVDVAIDATDLSLTGHLGPLTITARDQPSPTLQDASARGRDSSASIGLAFTFETGPGIPNQLALFDFAASGLAPASGWASLKPVVTADGDANLSLGVTTFVNTDLSLVDSLLPQFKFDLTVPLSVSLSASGFTSGALTVATPGSGNVYFDNIVLEAAPLISNLVGPFVKELDKWVASPLLSVVEPLFLSGIPLKSDVQLYQADYSLANLTKNWSWWDLLTGGATAAIKSGVTAAAEAAAQEIAAGVSGLVSGVVNEIALQFDTNGDNKVTLYELLSSSIDLLHLISTEKPAIAKAILQYRLGDPWGAMLTYAMELNGLSRDENLNNLVEITSAAPMLALRLTSAGEKMLAELVKAYDLPPTSRLQNLIVAANIPVLDLSGKIEAALGPVIEKIHQDAGLRSLISTAHTVLGIVEHVYDALKTIQSLADNMKSLEGDVAASGLGLQFGNRAFNLFGEAGKPVTGELRSVQTYAANSAPYANILQIAQQSTFADRYNPVTGEFYLSPDEPPSAPAPDGWVPDKPMAELKWLDGAGDPPPALAGVIAKVEDVLRSLASVGVEIPVIVDVEQVLGALIVGRPVQLITYDPQLEPFSGQLKLPLDLIDLAMNTVLPALVGPTAAVVPNAVLRFIRGGLALNASAELDLSFSLAENLKFGIDTHGLNDWVASGYDPARMAGNLLDSFFLTTNTATRTLADGTKITQFLPAFELSLEPSLLIGAGVANKEISLPKLMSILDPAKAPPSWANGITIKPGLIEAAIVAGLKAPSLWTVDLNVPRNGQFDGALRLSDILDNPFGFLDISSAAALSVGGYLGASVNPSRLVIDWGAASNWWWLLGPFGKALADSVKDAIETVGNAVVSSLPRYSIDASGATGGILWDTIGADPP